MRHVVENVNELCNNNKMQRVACKVMHNQLDQLVS